ncbi:VC0807 family protein [Paraburkholderia sp.]|uniref:VC0807 family protein n=1 Tax=Paraburkholderia sp. TaxID=1926495 RepID=UPI0023978D6C|nr:VC0807 family protein [Paraburkholderia sp.]MDE1184605.1 hypothetical protein [Paraburkholderia sp.]
MKLRPAFVLEMLFNLLLPWLAYRYAQPHWGETGGLIASAVPPLVWSAVELARFRRVDALSAIVLAGIVLSIGAMALGGSPRMLLLRESLVSGAVGVAFLMSLAMRRPLIFHLARATVARESADGPARLDAAWHERPALASTFRLMTLVWGSGLTAETAIRAWLAWTWPVERFLVVSPVISYAIYGGLTAWTFWFRKRLQTRVTVSAAPPNAQ